LHALLATTLGRMSAASELDPAGAHSWAAYGRLLVALYWAAGRPSFREMEQRGKRGRHPIAASTARNLATGTAGRPQRRSIEGYLYGCKVRSTEHAAWLDAWDRLARPVGDVGAGPAAARSDGTAADPGPVIGAALERAVIRGAELLPGFWTRELNGLQGAAGGYRLIAAFLETGELKPLVNYLDSPDFRLLAPLLAAFRDRSGGVAEGLREQLLHGVRLALGVTGGRLRQLTNALVDALHDANIREFLGGGSGVARLGEATATANARLLAGLTDLAPLRDVAARLRSRVAALHAEIRLPHTGQNRSVPWESLYVSPTLRVLGDREQASVEPGEFLLPTQRSVVLGDPGAGKSTLAAKLAYDVATSTNPDHEYLVPFLVVLRDLSRAMENGKRSLVEHLLAVSEDPYHVELTTDTLKYLLLNARAAVILDGLDELTDVALRSRVVRLIEGFAAAYPWVPIVVTSRRIGYLDAPLPPRMFTTYTIESFDAEQVASYARGWFSLDEGTAPTARAGLAEAFLGESWSIEDLRSNPLLLSLLCAMYSAEHFIPRNRAQIYERCALMVFERWDRMRLEQPMLTPFAGEVRAAVQRLAWHVLAGGGDGRLLRSAVLRLLAEPLTAKHYNEDEAARMAEDFLAFCAGRAWVLAELGMDGAEPVYGFAHRTFLEFFAAEYLVRHNPSPEQVWAVLAEHVGDGSWEVVGQLALQLVDRNLADGADRVLSVALDAADRPKDVLEFAARALQHVTPSPPIAARIVDKLLDRSLALPVTSRIVPWPQVQSARDAILDADYAVLVMVDSSLDTNARSLLRAFASRLASEAAADNDVALLLTEQFGVGHADRLRRSIVEEVVRASPEAFARWRERAPWHELQRARRDPAALAEVCARFGPAPLYMVEYWQAILGPPYWVKLFRAVEVSSSVIALRDALLRAPLPWLPWTVPPVAGSPQLPHVEQWWVSDAGRATFPMLALPYLEAAEGVEFAKDSEEGLLRTLATARRAHRVWKGRSAEPATAEFEALALRDAYEAWDALVRVLDEAGVTGETADFLLSWARCDFSVTAEALRD